LRVQYGAGVKASKGLQCDKDLISQSVIWDNVKPN
jgi:hypothetical protein